MVSFEPDSQVESPVLRQTAVTDMKFSRYNYTYSKDLRLKLSSTLFFYNLAPTDPIAIIFGIIFISILCFSLYSRPY